MLYPMESTRSAALQAPEKCKQITMTLPPEIKSQSIVFWNDLMHKLPINILELTFCKVATQV